MANKRKCKQCKEYFLEGVKTGKGFFCTYEHASEWAQNKVKAKRNNERKKELTKLKQEVKPIKKWLDEAQAVFNKFIRLRDKCQGCISCDKPASWDGQWHASHLISRGSSSFLRFNEDNVHKSCSVCNKHLSGNVGEFERSLRVKLGNDRVDYLLTAPRMKRWTVEEAKEIIKEYKLKVKDLS